MTSPLLALFTRALREDTRAKGAYLARAGLAGFLLIVMFIVAWTSSAGSARGLGFLANAIYVQTLFLTISGLAWFASSITEEKEEEMLGLLRMTDLSPLSILLGKSTNRLCGALLLIATQLPFTLIAVTLGGVSLEQVLAAYATLAAFAFVFCNLALLCSVIAPRTGSATIATAIIMGLIWLMGETVPALIWLRVLSPFAQYEQIFATGFYGPVLGPQVRWSILAGALFFLAAWLVFERFADRQLGGAAAEGRWQRRVRKFFSPGRASAFNPLNWKDFHFLHGGWKITTMKFVLSLGVLALFALVAVSKDEDVLDSQKAFFVLGVGFLWLILEAGFIASRICSCEVRDRTLSSLALLPQNLDITLSRKVPAGWKSLLPAFVFLGLGFAFLLMTLLSSHRPGIANEVGAFIVVGGIVGGYVFAMTYLGVCLAAHLSLRMKRGAYPLSIIICVALSCIAIIPVLGWYGVPVFAAIYGHSLRAKTLRRLEELAAED
jgi:hypothetical protein